MRHSILICFISVISMISSAQTVTHRDASRWVEEKSWNNGWNVAPDKSINPIEFASQYAKNKELWDSMFIFLAESDLNEIALGEHQIVPGRCWATVSEYVPKTTNKGNIESHKKFIDLQYVLRGNEQMGLAKDVTVKKEYNPDRDVAFWYSQNITYYNAGPESFFLFFPSDIHQPSVHDGQETTQSRKVVIKIEYVD